MALTKPGVTCTRQQLNFHPYCDDLNSPMRFLDLFDDVLLKIAYECSPIDIYMLERVRVSVLTYFHCLIQKRRSHAEHCKVFSRNPTALCGSTSSGNSTNFMHRTFLRMSIWILCRRID